jgi:Type I phosphodiesterase / nucleotide pyrophosphatase
LASAQLSQHGLTYVKTSTSTPSDSFPGLLAQVTGGTPRSTGVWYDVSYDRALSPPDACPDIQGTPVAYDEQIDTDSHQLDGGGGINPEFARRSIHTAFCG